MRRMRPREGLLPAQVIAAQHFFSLTMHVPLEVNSRSGLHRAYAAGEELATLFRVT